MADPKLVGFYCISTHMGGAEQSLLDIVSHLEELSEGAYKPWLIFPRSSGPLLDVLTAKGIEYTVLEMPASLLQISRQKKSRLPFQLLKALPGMLKYILQLRKLLHQSQPSLVYSTGLKCHLLALLVCRFPKIPTCIHFRDLLPSNAIRSVFKILSQGTHSSIISNSEATSATLPFRSTVIYNGLNIQKFREAESGSLKTELGIKTETPVVGILGALAHWKGQKFFIQVAEQLIQDGCHAHFVIIGDEIYDTAGDRGLKKELHQLITELDIGHRVHLLGFRKNPEKALKDIDILVHASLRPEPFGRVILEGLASGSMVVAADAGGAKEIIHSGENGFLCPPGDHQSYVLSIKKLLDSNELRQTFQSHSHKFLEKNFKLEKQLEKIIHEFKKVA